MSWLRGMFLKLLFLSFKGRDTLAKKKDPRKNKGTVLINDALNTFHSWFI